MTYEELRFYLLEQIEMKDIRFKVEVFIILDKAETQLLQSHSKCMSAYAEIINMLIENAVHRNILLELKELIKPFLQMDNLVHLHS